MSSVIISRSLDAAAIDIARRCRPACLAGVCSDPSAAAGFLCSAPPSAATSSRLAKFSGSTNTLCDALLWCRPGLCDILKPNYGSSNQHPRTPSYESTTSAAAAAAADLLALDDSLANGRSSRYI
ncbi:hypothetical protein GUJ93_ZPchr0001g32963 [Zizania palustris]|uniref:Uncharacterized protein n=1 Tax=Zizania palustris TaxID=103762 RepID=A0A8J5SCH4_ZIZPA|nr:hypothetical protein GUJ93_ZPchr0001g32963 [Zizania palustris]